MSGVPIAVPVAKLQLAPAQYRNSTWATPESASLASALRLTPLLTVAPVTGAVIATLGGVVSGGPVETVTLTGAESVVLPTLSVARATSVYDPSAGWLVHVTAYGSLLSAVPIAVPVLQSQLAPAQYRNSTWATPESASLGAAETTCPFWIVAPSAGALSAKAAGPVLSGVTVKLLVAVKPAPLVAVTVCAPEALAPALQL